MGVWTCARVITPLSSCVPELKEHEMPEGPMERETREALADYHALVEYDLARLVRYGDMARSRRAREINRRGDELLRAGVQIDSTGLFPRVEPEELAAAFERVLRPRYRRWHASVQPFEFHGTTYRRFTKHARGTAAAWRATAAKCGVDL